MKRDKWPFSPDTEITQNTARIELSSGVLLSTAISKALSSGQSIPPHSIKEHHGWQSRVFRWEDVERWLQSQGLHAIGPSVKRGGAGQAISQPENGLEAYNWEAEKSDLKAQLLKMQTRVLEVESENNRVKNHFRSMTIKQDGLLSGSEILARAMPAANLTAPGVYFLIDGIEIVYVGQSTNVFSRVQTHLAEQLKMFKWVFVLRCHPSELSNLERLYIRRFRPKYNMTMKNGGMEDQDDLDRIARARPRGDIMGRQVIVGVDDVVACHDSTH